MRDAEGRISKERPSQALVLVASIDGEPRQNHDRNRIAQVPSELPRNRSESDCARGERVVADDGLAITSYIGSRGAACLVGASAASEPVVQDRLARIEAVDLVNLGQGLRRPERHALFPGWARPHGLEKPLVRLRRSIQALKESAIVLGSDREHGAVQKRVLGRSTCGFENEIRPILPGEFGCPVDQLTDLRLDPKIERFAFPALLRYGSHMEIWNEDSML